VLRILIVVTVWLAITGPVLAEEWQEPEIQVNKWVEPKQTDIDAMAVETKKIANNPTGKTDLFNSEVGKAKKFFTDYNYSQPQGVLGEKQLPNQFIDDHYKKLMTKPDTDKPKQLSSNILVFATFSMKDEDLINLGKDLAKLNGHLVFNGLLVDAQTTVKKISELINTSGESIPVMVDPTMFERFNVTSVPVYIIPKDGISPCFSNDNCPVPENISAKGLMPVSYFLEKVISSDNQAYKERAVQWLEIL